MNKKLSQRGQLLKHLLKNDILPFKGTVTDRGIVIFPYKRPGIITRLIMVIKKLFVKTKGVH